MSYNAWPLPKLPKELQRPELAKLKKMGYKFDDARDVVSICEKKIAKFFGSEYCVVTDCCSHAIFLSLEYLKFNGEISRKQEITIPKHTYISVPMQILHAGLLLKLRDYAWKGSYELEPTRVMDAAVVWEEGGYVKNSLMCLSFQIKKAIPTGRMGAVLTDNKDAAEWIRLASYDGRDLSVPYDSDGHVKMMGWHMYATPEDCARTIILMDAGCGINGAYLGSDSYPDIEQMMEGIL